MCRLSTITSPLIKKYFLQTYYKTASYTKWQLLITIYNCHFIKPAILNNIYVQNNCNFILWPSKKDFICNIFSKTYGFSKLPTSQRMIHTTNANLKNANKSKKFPDTPNILYYQSPTVWLKNKWQMRKLRNSWDPEFNQNEFTRGAKQALSVITQMISTNNLQSLNGLIVKQELLRVRRDIKLLWRHDVVQNIGVEPEQIKLAIPIHIQLNSIAGLQLCQIDMFFVALKWLDTGDLLAIHYVARFFRNYNDRFMPEWTVSKFYVKRYHIRRITLKKR